MFKIFVILLSTFIFISVSSASSIVDRRNGVIKIIDEELKEVRRLNKQIGSRNPKLLLRMAELYLEKARLIKENENLKYLSLSPEERQRANKSSFFKTSRYFFKRAQKVCYLILKRFKRFKGKSDVYYILAYNAKEFNKHKQSEIFFKKSIKSSRRSSYTKVKSRLALAEVYYNNKKYSKAVPLYESGLKSKRNKWWTKDSFNLAWCYFRVGKKTKAISKMLEVLRYSKKSKYMDMSYAVERDLAFFYSDSGKIKQAIRFYKKIGKDVALNLLRVGKYLKSQGRFTSAQKTFSKAINHTSDNGLKAKIYIELLSLYERFGRYRGHLKVCKSLVALKDSGALNSSQINVLTYHVKKMSSMLQKQVVGKSYRGQAKALRRKSALAVEYFTLLGKIDAKGSLLAVFHSAETMYAARKYSSAISMYDTAFERAKSSGNRKIEKLSLDGMMASLSGRGISRTKKDKYLLKVYREYLKRTPKGKHSNKIYQRLFSAYVAKLDMGSAEKVLVSYRSYYPRAIRTQEAMLAKIIDHYKSRGNRKVIESWYRRIRKGEFVVSSKYAKKIKLIVLTMQFENVEKASSRGDKKRALRGYVEIYKAPDSSKDAKKNAAYNIAILFHELDNAKYTYLWSKRALELMNGNDVKKYESSFIYIAAGLINQRKMKESADIYKTTFVKLCRKKSINKKVFFKNAIVAYLANGNIPAAEKVSSLSYRCKVGTRAMRAAHLDILKAMGEQKRWSMLTNKIAKLSRIKKMRPYLTESFVAMYRQYEKMGRSNEAAATLSKILKYYKIAKRSNMKLSLEVLNIIASSKLKAIDYLVEKLKTVELAFPEKRFQNAIKKKFAILNDITTRSVAVLDIGSGRGIVRAYDILTESYAHFATSVLGFSPAGKSEKYISSFKKDMALMVKPIAKKAREYREEATRQIIESRILSYNNHKFIGSKKYDIGLQFFPYRKGVLMDKGGRK